MDELFERFVFKYVETLLAQNLFTATYQSIETSTVIDLYSGRTYQRVIPDILLQKASAPKDRLPIDAKYKLYDENKVSPEDVYQCFFYAQAFTARSNGRTPLGFLVYPTSANVLVTRKLRILPPQGVQLADISVFGLPLPQAIHEMKCGDGPVTAALRREILLAF